ncbi:MAG: hypothetical protein HYR94_01365, partial [Chloroflexi bacterium]|nr:hypothetical protein [Chloroflexota bacterium]
MIINPKSKIQNPKLLPLWPAFIAVTLTAAFFRFYHLADHPLGLFFDPAINGLDAIRLMQRGGPVIFFPTNGGREALLIYLLIPFIWLFGTTPFAFRLQLAIISLLNIVCLFSLLYDLRFTIYDLRFTQRETDNSIQSQRPFMGHSKFPVQHSSFTIHNSSFTIWFATLAGLVLAVSPWHIAISRGDQRPLIVPLLAVLVFWFFLKGWTTDRRRWFILSGLFMGLGLHTYSAARLLPLILILALLPELFLRQTPDATSLSSLVSRPPSLVPRLTLLILTALLIASPTLWYFFNHPAQFSARAASVLIWTYLDTPAGILAELGRNLLRVLGFFCCTGSPNAIFGLPDYPGLSPLLTPFLIIGFLHTLKNWRNLFARLVALWWLIGISPSIIAIEAPHPLRLIVALPPTAILVAIGLSWVAGGGWRVMGGGWRLSRLTPHASRLTPHASRFTLHASRFTLHASRLTLRAPRFTLHALPLALILATIPPTFSAYFVEWTRLPVTQGIYDYGAVAIRDAVLAHAGDARPVYLPLARFDAQPLLFYLSGTFKRQAALTIPPADTALIISPEKNERDSVWVRLQGDAATILPPLTAEGQQLLQSALAGDSTESIQTPRGETVARLAPLPADPARFVQQPTRPLAATFGPAQLIGVTYPAVIDPASRELPITLYWQALSPMSDDYEVVLQLVDDNRHVWGDGTARPNDWVYPTSFWRPGLDTIAAQQFIKLNTSALAPGRYWLAVALYDPATGQRFPLTDGLSDSPDTFFAGPLKVPLPSPPPLPFLEGGGIKFGNVAQLSGFRLDTPTVAAGEPVQLSLLWQALGAPPLDYTVFVHVVDDRDAIVAQRDAQPQNYAYPTSLWTAGEYVVDTYT